MVQAVSWERDHLRMIDQTRIPEKKIYLQLNTVEEIFEAIRNLRVRGAPAIGVTAAYGLYLGMRNDSFASPDAFFAKLQTHIDYLASARPTAVNLFWAMEHIKNRLQNITNGNVDHLKSKLLDFAIELHEDDRQRCDLMADFGQEVIPENARILTHCNTGALATGGIGTAFGVIYRAHQLGKNIEVFADETRPVLQGARLTMFELIEAGIPANLICDNMAAALMQQKKVDLVVLGSDRVSADGSAANKIGTYGVAVLAKYHQIPFYVAAPLSTFDLSISAGKNIPIENRNNDEIRNVFGKCYITVQDADCWNPAFDVTPPELISGIITERGILRPPYVENIQKTFNSIKN